MGFTVQFTMYSMYSISELRGSFEMSQACAELLTGDRRTVHASWSRRHAYIGNYHEIKDAAGFGASCSCALLTAKLVGMMGNVWLYPGLRAD